MADDFETGMGSRPVPDPTLLTTEALLREVARLEALLGQRIEGFSDAVDEKIATLRAEMRGVVSVEQGRFERIALQLEAIERTRLEQKHDTAEAITAALTSQKDAATKSEAATTKSIDQLGMTFSAALDGFRRETSDLKDRITAVEQQKIGRQETTGGVNATIGVVVGVAGILIAIAAVVLAGGG